MTTIIVFVFIWYIIGVIGYVYWWGYRDTLRISTGVFLIGLLTLWIIGPFTWLVGYLRLRKNKI